MAKYSVYLTTKLKYNNLKKGTGIIVLEPDDYSKADIKHIKSKGYKVLAYLSVGTIEKERPWWNKYKKYRLQQLEDWPNEYYIDVTKRKWRDFIVSRAKELKDKGFDGFWCDNLDVYEYNKSSKMFVSCQFLLKKLKKLGYIMVNGGAEFWEASIRNKIALKSIVNGVTQEEVFTRILSYSGKGKFGKQKSADKNFYKSLLKQLKKRGISVFVLEYTRSKEYKNSIIKWCKENKVSYCISEDVNL